MGVVSFSLNRQSDCSVAAGRVFAAVLSAFRSKPVRSILLTQTCLWGKILPYPVPARADRIFLPGHARHAEGSPLPPSRRPLFGSTSKPYSRDGGFPRLGVGKPAKSGGLIPAFGDRHGPRQARQAHDLASALDAR